MIIGSLILPGKVVYSLAVILVIQFFSFSLLELIGVIPHFTLKGYFVSSQYQNLKFVLISNLVFGFVIFMSVYFSNGVARQLYKLEQDLYESFEKLKEAEKEKQKYVMGVVHEIKAPLTAVSSLLDIILKKMLGPLEPSVEERIQRAFIRTTDAVSLINNVLRVSKLRLLDEIVTEEFEVKDIIIKVLDNFKVSFEKKNIKYNLIDNRILEKNVLGDGFLFEMVISNLISNAIKYTDPDGNVLIEMNGDEKSVEIIISDNGIGIPKDDLLKMFGDFYRASNVKKGSTEGTGLGLSIVKQIVEKHKGTIDIDSPSKLQKEGRPGTVVNLKLVF